MFLSHESIEIDTLDGSIRGKIPQVAAFLVVGPLPAAQII